MKVLVACEESQRVCKAFLAKGHDAWSCDLRYPSGGRFDRHIRKDVLTILDEGWDLMIAHPPCTYLCVPGAHYLHTRPERWQQMEDGKAFFLALYNSSISKICVENPLPHRYAELPKYTQIIQPWQFGHEISKRTCLWLKNLPLLMPTSIVDNHGERYIRTERQIALGYGKTSNSKWYAGANKVERSRTFIGIAKAMADQWG